MIEQAPCNQIAVQERLRIDPAALTRHFKILEKEGLKLNEVFFHYIKNNKPLVISKTAISMDGKIATKHMESQWISNESCREMTHEYRN